MSFSSDAKLEIVENTGANPCCITARVYAFLLFNKCIEDKRMNINVGKSEIAKYMAFCLDAVFHDGLVQKMVDNEYHFSVDDHIFTKYIASLGHTGEEIHLRINFGNLECEECVPAFLSSAFLSCGSVSNPQREYHLEFSVGRHYLAKDLCFLLGEAGIESKVVLRKGQAVVYIKESEMIEDLLTLVGAPLSALSLMNVKIYKDVRNKVNRVTNCETANIDKSVSAAAAQIADFTYLKNHMELEHMPEDLQKILTARLEYPESSLSELADLLGITKSSLYHKIGKLRNTATQLKREVSYEK